MTLSNNLNYFFGNPFFTGAIVTFDNFQRKKNLINKIIDFNNNYIFHCQVEKDKNSSGYISFYNKNI